VDGTNNGSEILAYYLYTRLRRGDHTCGPYLQKCEQFIRPGANGLSALYSPWNGRYVYANITGPHTAGRPRVVVIDPGRDRQLGGVIDPQAGFVPNGTDANGDGAPDHKDNFKNNSL
jgi:hypothetical protein